MFEQYSIGQTAEELKSDIYEGLTQREAGERLRRDGRNEMKAARKKTPIESFLEQLNDPLIYVLIVAAVVSVLLGEISDAVIIGVVVVMNALVGMLQEGKARKALESLKKLTSPKAMVIREGRRMEVPAAELVKGDLVYLEAGCQVPADLRLTESANLKIEESALTGESLPMDKDADFVGAKGRQLPLGDRRNMAYMSTIVTYGRGEGLVTATGMGTELGQIAAMITESKEEMTPLQKRLGELGKVLSLLSLLLCAALFVIAVLQERNVPEMLITAISLAVAAVPEGLPAVVTICLALSVTRMVKVNTIVRRLPSVETLGAVSVVCSDKTGTLTQNRMTVEKCWLDGRLLQAEDCSTSLCEDFYYGMVLCNDAILEEGNRTGDPTELALLDVAARFGLRKEALEMQMPRMGELSFDSDRKMMTTLHSREHVRAASMAAGRRGRGAALSGGSNFETAGRYGSSGNAGYGFTSGEGELRAAQFSGGRSELRAAWFSGGRGGLRAARFSGGRGEAGGAQFSGGRGELRAAQFSGGRGEAGGAQFSGGGGELRATQFSGGRGEAGGAQFSGGRGELRAAQFSGGRRKLEGTQFPGGRGDLRAVEFRTEDAAYRMGGYGSAQMVSYTKGAPDEVLKQCTQIFTRGGIIRLTEQYRRRIKEAVEEMSGEALRTLAVAMRTEVMEAKEENLTFLGLIGMRDPARPEAARAVADFKEAGVKTVMITGDHVDTAFAIGRQLGIADHFGQCMTGEELSHLPDAELTDRIDGIRVFARVSPAQKVRIVDGFKQRGEIVAMTGDGVNDAPSLKKADIGIAMGMAGTDVARQASDMILTDDNFATIRRAIEEGRGVYENIRKSVIFLLSSNLGEIITMFLAVICGLASPLKSSHILWINLITDSLPALALGVDKNDGAELMKQPPRKAKESLFSGGRLACTCFYGALIAAVSLTAFLMLPCALLRINGQAVSLGNLAAVLQSPSILAKAQTYAFTVLGMSQLFHAVGMRDMQKSVLRMNHLENKLMIGACILGFLLQFAVTEAPFLIQAFGTSSLSGREWMRLGILAAAPLFAHEIIALFAHTKELS